MYATSLTAILAAVSSANAAYQGFNYGAAFTDGSIKSEQDFEAEFRAAADLAGTNGDFSSARLYTMIQGGSANDPISAIQAAINTRTTLLLGLWASAGAETFANELRALERTIEQYGDELDGLIAGISVGSEDLYRISPIGIEAGSNPGAEPDTIIDYINQVRQAVQGTSFANYPIGHVDTSTAWFNGSNSVVAEACDFIGFNAFAYFEDTQDNDISNGKALFDRALQRTRDAVGDKPIWITETGWPVSGENFGNAVASTDNAETFWQDVGCPLFGETNVWWYLLRYSPNSPSPDFGVIGTDINSSPRYDLSCSARSTSSSATGAASTTRTTLTQTEAVPSATGTDVVVPPQPTETDGEDEEVSTPTAPADGGDEQETTSEQGAAPTEQPGQGGDDGSHHDGVVPGPPPTTLSVAPTEAATGSGNDTVPAPQPTESTVEPAAASAMSFSAAFLAMMLAVALF